MEQKPVKPELEHLCTLHVNLGEPIIVGQVPLGERRVVPILGGTFKGAKFSGEILPGADWQYLVPGGSAMVDAKYLLKTDDGALLTVHNHGWRCYPPDVVKKLSQGEFVDTTKYYFRATPEFETASPQYAWLNEVVAVCSGVRSQSAVVLDFYTVS